MNNLEEVRNPRKKMRQEREIKRQLQIEETDLCVIWKKTCNIDVEAIECLINKWKNTL